MHAPIRFSLIALVFLPLIVGCVHAQSDRYASHYSGYQSQSEYANPELDALLAPIALYPDTLLSHILIASTYPLEVVQANRWVKANPHLNGDKAIAAAANQPWDASVKALVAFPDVLERMSNDLHWTEQLGDAFLEDEQFVMQSVQRLRNRAYDEGNLADTEHVNIQRENSIVVIEPRHTNIIYTPYYDTRVVYGDWWWPDYPPTYWYAPARISHHTGFYWGPSVSLSSGFFFSGFNWHNRRLLVVDRPHLHRPIYSSRAIARHQHARYWQHNPVHRRGVAYREGPSFNRYHGTSNRPAQPPRRPINVDRPHRDNPVRVSGPSSRDAAWRNDRPPVRQNVNRDRPRATPNSPGRPSLEDRLRERASEQSTRPTHENNRPRMNTRPSSEHRAPNSDSQEQRPNRPTAQFQGQTPRQNVGDQRPTRPNARPDSNRNSYDPNRRERSGQQFQSQQRPVQQRPPQQRPQRSLEQRPAPAQRHIQPRNDRERFHQHIRERRESGN